MTLTYPQEIDDLRAINVIIYHNRITILGHQSPKC